MGLFDDSYTYNPYVWGDWTETYRTLDGTLTHRGYTYDPTTSTINVTPSDMWPTVASSDQLYRLKKLKLDEEEQKVDVHKKETHTSNERAVVCENFRDLSTECVLTTLSAVKGKLMLELMPFRIKSMECRITPTVKSNIITASKKLKMYGKNIPIVPHFDEWGNRLPDEINIGSASGITLKIVDPEDYGEFYFELRATLFPDSDNYYDPVDVPF